MKFLCLGHEIDPFSPPNWLALDTANDWIIWTKVNYFTLKDPG